MADVLDFKARPQEDQQGKAVHEIHLRELFYSKNRDFIEDYFDEIMEWIEDGQIELLSANCNR